jgi:GT2 family glycosyltransferase
MTARVAVVVLNWNGGDHLAPCLLSVAALTYPDREVWVVDNASTDGSARDLPTQWPEFRHIANARNLGYAGGNNVAIRASQSDYVLLVNNDTVLEPGLLEPMVAACEADPRVAACSPKVLYFDRPDTVNAAGLTLTSIGKPVTRGRDAPDGDPALATRCEVFGAHGACVLYRRAALDAVGLFDEDFFAYHEEFDLAWRLRLAGWRAVYEPAARLRHHEGKSLARTPDRILWLTERNRFWALAKNAGAGFVWRALPGLLREELGMVRHCLGLRTLVPLTARFAALAGLPKMLAKRGAVQRLRTVPDDEMARWFG